MTAIHVTYEQYRHRAQDVETHTATYSSYADVVASACAYLAERSGRFPNEVYEIMCKGSRTYVADVVAVKNKLLADGCNSRCNVYLTLDGSTGFGTPILQCVTISAPALVEKAPRVSICNGCNDPDCDSDCGMLPCGCIDVCRGCY